MPALHCTVAAHCGGCPQIGLSIAEQRKSKAANLAGLLRSHGHHTKLLEAWTGDLAQPFRNRVRMRVRKGRPEFFNAAKEQGCPVLLPSLWDLIHRLREFCNRHPERLSAFSHLEIRAPDEQGLGVVTFYVAACEADDVSTASLPFAEAAELYRSVDSRVRLVGWCYDAARSVRAPRQRMSVSPGTYALVPSCSFVQVNSSVNRQLVRSVVSGLKGRGAATFFELFSGAGNFTLPLLASGMRGTSVERAPEAVHAASAAAAEQRLVGEFLQGDAGRLTRERVRQGQEVDAVISDAPRAGLKSSGEYVAALRPAHVVLVCCDPKSALRDAARLQSRGYILERVQPFDMFPHTAHTEVALWLRRSG